MTQLYFYKKPITFSTAYSLLTRIKLSDEAFGSRDWGMVIKLGKRAAKSWQEPAAALEQFCLELSEAIFWGMGKEQLRQEREDARASRRSASKMGSWSLAKARGPVRGAKQGFIEKTTFQEWFKRVEGLLRRYFVGVPEQQLRQRSSNSSSSSSSNAGGRPPVYDPYALATLVLLTKLEGGNYAAVVKHANSAGLDCRLTARTRFPPGRAGTGGDMAAGAAVPCRSYVHRLATKGLEPSFYQAFLKKLMEEAFQVYQQRLAEPCPSIFAVDGMDLPTTATELRKVNQNPASYAAGRAPFQVTSHLVTNTVCNLVSLEHSGQAPLDKALAQLPLPAKPKTPGAGGEGVDAIIVLADKLYDIEDNHLAAETAKVELHIPGKLSPRGNPYQGAARARTWGRFDPWLYRQRKKGERFFGNLTSRGVTKLRGRSKQSQTVELLLVAIAHNLLALRAQEFYAQAFTLVPPAQQ